VDPYFLVEGTTNVYCIGDAVDCVVRSFHRVYMLITNWSFGKKLMTGVRVPAENWSEDWDAYVKTLNENMDAAEKE